MSLAVPRLVVSRTRLDSLELGPTTSLTALPGARLTVNPDDLSAAAQAAAGDALGKVRVEVASPGDSTRIVHVLDALPALARTDDQGRPFPGFLNPPVPSARGGVATFDNLAVLTCAQLPWGVGGLLIARESTIDMSGPLSRMNPFGSTHNVVLRIDLAPDRADVEYEAAVRRAGLAVAEALGAAAASAPTPIETAYQLSAPETDLPKIAYIYQVHSQGLHARSFLYGKELDGMVPAVVHPNELLEGALVSGNYVYGAFKTPTWLHVNNPVVQRLYARHGRDHNFVGIVLSRGHHYSAWEKERSASLAAHQAHLLGADGVALTWEGGGNSITDAMQTIRACERLGIRTAAVSYEMGEEDAADVLLLDSVPEADALVSSGNTSRKVTLPHMERVLGGDDLRLRPEIGGEHVPAEGPLPVDNDYLVFCAAAQTGFGTRAGVAY